MYKNKTITVVIPCHNEEEGIVATCKKIPQFVDEKIVVNNLSTDKTAILAKKAGAKVINEKNKGYGYAIKKGIQEARGEIIIVIDGDGTYPVENSKEIIDYLLTNKLDFISCNRFPLSSKDNMKWQNYFGNKLLTLLMSILFMHRFYDGLSGMWVFNKNIYELLLPLSSSWNLSEEIKIKALNNPEVKFKEYHVNYHLRLGESKVWPLKVGIINILYLFYLRFPVFFDLISPKYFSRNRQYWLND